MKSVIQNYLMRSLVMVAVLLPTACLDDTTEPAEDPIASFQFVISETNHLEVTFTNFSQNAEVYAWDFGDGNLSVDENPVHTYEEEGVYDVLLTAVNADGVTHTFTDEVSITSPNLLLGTWQLLADASTGVNTFEVGPSDRSQVWWSLGGVEELCVRECLFNDTWTFNDDDTYDLDNQGDFWGEGGIWPEGIAGTCFDATDANNWVGADGQDLSGWNSGNYGYEYDAGAATLTVTGGFIGLTKAATFEEVTEPQATVTYKVVKLVDADVDTLVLETELPNPGYWSFTLVKYDDPTDAVVVEECPEVTEVNVTFKLNFNDYTGSATTPAVNGTFNNWCGDCNSMTDEDGDGIWETTLVLPVGDHEFKYSADGWNDQEALEEGSDCTVTNDGFTNRTLTVGMDDMTVGPVCWNSCENCPVQFSPSSLVGDWTLLNDAGAMGVGPGSGDISWWANSADDVTTRSCAFDDVFTFGDDGSFSIAMDGSTWVESWQEGVDADGCGTPVAPHDGSGTYTYEATETTIKVIGSGAFIGLAKAVNEGELSGGAAIPEDVTYTVTGYGEAADGTKSLTIEIEAGTGVFWTFKLQSI